MNLKIPVAKNLYSRFIEKKLPLNDQLAAARSILANERTFLSYQRTALALAVAGFSLIKFFDLVVLEIVGWVMIPAAAITIVLGVMRYIRMRDLIRNLEIQSQEIPDEKLTKDRKLRN